MNQVSQSSTLLSREDAAAYLGIRPQTLATWACNKRYSLRFIKIGRRVMYRLTDIEAFIEERTVGGEALQ